MARKNKYKFLSESILLEESGLPIINTIVIVTVTLLILTFLSWASFVIMEESVSISGQVIINTTNQEFELIGKVGTQDIIAIEEGTEVYISIPGITGRHDLSGELRHIDTEPKYDKQGTVFYNVHIDLTLSDQRQREVDNVLIAGMESRIKIVTGTKSMLQYLLGNLYETGRDTFNIK